MTVKEKVVNFCYQIDRPFTTHDITDRCCVNYNTAKRIVRELRKAGKIRLMRKKGNSNLLIWDEKPKMTDERKYGWAPQRNKLNKLIEIISNKPCRLCDINEYSSSTISRYVKILVALGNLSRDARGYYHVISSKLPTKIEAAEKLLSAYKNDSKYPLKKESEYIRMQSDCVEPCTVTELFYKGYSRAMVKRAIDRGFLSRTGNKVVTRKCI